MKLLYAFFCLLTGAFLAYRVKRRQFNRTNKYGTEEFRSYVSKATTTAVEKVAWFLSLSLIVAGVLLVAA